MTSGWTTSSRPPAPDPALLTVAALVGYTALGCCDSLEAVSVSIPVLKFDAVIVGAGGAGLRSAIQLSEAGLKTAVLTKGFPDPFPYRGGAGRVAASLGNSRRITGTGTCTTPSRVRTGSATRTPSNSWYEGQPSASSNSSTTACPSTVPTTARSTSVRSAVTCRTSAKSRCPFLRCRGPDRPRHAARLYQRNVKANTQFFVEWMALDLIRDAEGAVVGVTAMEMETGEVVIFHTRPPFRDRRCRPHFYSSTNAFINTGDGLGMAARAGIPLEDMEFWQFHPTGVAGAGVLITEGVRGEGGICAIRRGASWSATPRTKDLASRDVVPRHDHRNQRRPRLRSNKDHVLLDITHLDAGRPS